MSKHVVAAGAVLGAVLLSVPLFAVADTSLIKLQVGGGNTTTYINGGTLGNLGNGADQACIAKCAALNAKANADHNQAENCPMLGRTAVTCGASPLGGSVTGICIYGKGCQALNASGLGGSGNALDKGLQMLGQMLGKLLQNGNSGNSGNGNYNYNNQPVCPNGTYITHQVTSDPCAKYVECQTQSVICKTGYHTESVSGNDSSGCPLPDKCVKDKCTDPGHVDCLPGYYSVSGGDDSNGCPLINKCVSNGVLFSGSPTSGNAPLEVTFSTNDAEQGHVLTIDFGDNASTSATACTTASDGSCTSPGVNKHTYTTAGSYTATLTGTSSTKALGSVDISVASTTATSTGVMLIISPKSGPVPLDVTFKTFNDGTNGGQTLAYGDGSTDAVAICPTGSDGSCTGPGSNTHTYTAPGAYAVTLSDDATGNSLATASVNAASSTSSNNNNNNNNANNNNNNANGNNTNGNNNSSNNLNTYIHNMVANNIGNSTNVGNTATSGSSVSLTGGTQNQQGGISPLQGGIIVSQRGATAVAGQTQNNTTITGFYGGSSSVSSGGFAAGLCENRPWDNPIVTWLIPSSFFDGLCKSRGLPVGQQATSTAQTQQPVLVQQSTPAQPQAPAATTTQPQATSTAPSGPARVSIWAVPASVPLDQRTSIFWSTQGVTQCTETSPDGSFSHATLSGGASTVPLAQATTFTISCLRSDGSHVTNYVTVNISI